MVFVDVKHPVYLVMTLGQGGHVEHEWVTERVGGGGVGIVRSCWGKSTVLGQSDSVLSGWVEGFGYAQVFGSGYLVISGVGN